MAPRAAMLHNAATPRKPTTCFLRGAEVAKVNVARRHARSAGEIAHYVFPADHWRRDEIEKAQ